MPRVDQKQAADSKECFVVCPIGPTNSDTRKRSNQVFKHIVCAVVEPMGYHVTRADTLDQSGIITTQIIDKLLNAELVVADLTDQNPNVFYELAVRHAVSKPFVHLMAEGQALPFDIQGLRTVFVDHRDLDSVEAAKNQLRGAVEAIEGGATVETPVTYTIDLQQLRQSDNSEARGIADLMQEVSIIKRVVTQNANRSRVPGADYLALRQFVEYLVLEKRLNHDDGDFLINNNTSPAHDTWARKQMPEDLWGPSPAPARGGFADEVPF